MVEQQKPEADKSVAAREKWNKQAAWYARFEKYEIPSVLSCVMLTDFASKTGPVIEVGCGPGLQSETLAKGFLGGDGSVLVSCDFSNSIVTLMKQRYAQSSFTAVNLGNKAVIDNETDYADPTNTDRVDLAKVIAQN